jgi:hypothetical protein
MKIEAGGRKFYFYPDNPEEGWIQIKVPSDTSEEQIDDEDFWCNVIIDWHNVEDDDESALVCSPENIKYVMKESAIIRMFVMKCFSDLANEITEYRKQLEKN